jgi:hypothetical protein
MNCHSQIWTNASMLEPVRESFRSGKPLVWNRVHRLPDFVHFNHSIHVAKGIGCASCHGPIDKMNLVYQASPLTMEWCLSCHRAPEKFIRPREEVFNMSYVAKNQATRTRAREALRRQEHDALFDMPLLKKLTVGSWRLRRTKPGAPANRQPTTANKTMSDQRH